MEISVIVPCYNEEASIKEFCNMMKDGFEKRKIKYELIFIDDGSTDDTFKLLKEEEKGNKSIKLISFSKNFGKEAAMYAGLSYASGKYISIMDADMQHTFDMLISMFDKLKEDEAYDIVCSYKSSRVDEKPLKRVLTSTFYKLNNKVSDVKLLPGASDFRIFKSCVKDAILSITEKDRFLKGIFSWIGYNTIYVPYTPEKRLHGNSKWSLLKLIQYSLNGFISFNDLPLRFFFFSGIIIFIISLLNFILIGKLGVRTLILLISYLILMIGVISLYLSKIYNNSLNRPIYIIKEKVGFDKK